MKNNFAAHALRRLSNLAAFLSKKLPPPPKPSTLRVLLQLVAVFAAHYSQSKSVEELPRNQEPEKCESDEQGDRP